MGNRTRSVFCQSSTQGVVNDNQCTGLRPKAMSYCNISPCKAMEWNLSILSFPICLSLNLSVCSYSIPPSLSCGSLLLLLHSICLLSYSRTYSLSLAGCERDLFPFQCNFVADSVMCNDPMYQEICCCTCRKTDFQPAGI